MKRMNEMGECNLNLDIWIVAWSWKDHSDTFQDVEHR